jgi:hypothetical protein
MSGAIHAGGSWRDCVARGDYEGAILRLARDCRARGDVLLYADFYRAFSPYVEVHGDGVVGFHEAKLVEWAGLNHALMDAVTALQKRGRLVSVDVSATLYRQRGHYLDLPTHEGEPPAEGLDVWHWRPVGLVPGNR